jgi:hypothetical protein
VSKRTGIDTEAIRLLIKIVMERGRCDLRMERRCIRITNNVNTLEKAIAELKKRRLQ